MLKSSVRVLLVLVAALETGEAHASEFEGDWTSAQGIVVHIRVADSKATATSGGAWKGESFEGSIKGKAIHWQEPSDAAGEIWELGQDGKVTDREGTLWTHTDAAVSLTTASTTTPATTLAVEAVTSASVATESPVTLPTTTTPGWWVPPSTSSHPKENRFMGWLHSIGLKEETDKAASLAAALDTNKAEARDFEGNWSNAQGIVVHIHVAGSKATATSGGAWRGTSFEGSIKGNVIHWQEPSNADGEAWELGQDGKVTDREGNLWTHADTAVSLTTTPATTTPGWWVPPSTSSHPKENRFMGWLHSIGLKEETSKAVSLATSLDTNEAESSGFEGNWTSSHGIVVHIHVTGSKVTATSGGAQSGESFEGSIKGKVIHWQEPSDADGETWELGQHGKVIDREGNLWTHTGTAASPTPATETSTPATSEAAAAVTNAPVATESPATTAPGWFVPPSTSSHPNKNGFMGWLHSIGLKEEHGARAKKVSAAASRWLLPACGAITMFSLVAFITSRIQRTQPFASTRTVSRNELVNQRDFDEELMAE